MVHNHSVKISVTSKLISLFFFLDFSYTTDAGVFGSSASQIVDVGFRLPLNLPRLTITFAHPFKVVEFKIISTSSCWIKLQKKDVGSAGSVIYNTTSLLVIFLLNIVLIF